MDLFLWDLDIPFDNINSKHDIIYWSRYPDAELDGIFSIPQLVEENADHLKTKYLRLIYEFGEAKVEGKRIIDHLIIRQNFSYWWMTLLAEKCNYAKSPQIDNIIKIMALEQWLKKNKYQKFILVTANEKLAMSVYMLAKRLLIDFEWKKEIIKKPNKGLIKIAYHSLPNFIQSPIWLMYFLFSNWPLKGVGLDEWSKTTATSTFVSYLFNLSPEAAKEGHYESPYWTRLTNLLDDNQHTTNWLHIYIKDNLLSTSKKARDLIKQFNSSQKNHQVHVTLSSFLSAPLIFKTLKDWYKVRKLNKLVCKQLQFNSGYLWPLFKKDCEDSISGIPAISNLLYFNLFEKAMSMLPIQKRGCYLQENQGWEMGFIHAWKLAGHRNNLIGFSHSTVRYWDLRYFFDPRSYNRKKPLNLPIPDYVGVNGEPSKIMYLSGGYPKKNLIEVESLRYLYLYNYSSETTKVRENFLKEKVVLIVGDYLKENTYKQLNLLSSSIEDIDQSVSYIIKPHPACPINMEDFPNLCGKLSTRPIQELMQICDVVYSGLVTSAVIDAYCVGLPIITFLDGRALNMSPLRAIKGVYFVQNSKDLSTAINTIEVSDLGQKRNYFYLDPGLPRWHKWLFNGFYEEQKKESIS